MSTQTKRVLPAAGGKKHVKNVNQDVENSIVNYT